MSLDAFVLLRRYMFLECVFHLVRTPSASYLLLCEPYPYCQRIGKLKEVERGRKEENTVILVLKIALRS